MSLSRFHPAVQRWFSETLGQPDALPAEELAQASREWLAAGLANYED